MTEKSLHRQTLTLELDRNFILKGLCGRKSGVVLREDNFGLNYKRILLSKFLIKLLHYLLKIILQITRMAHLIRL